MSCGFLVGMLTLEVVGIFEHIGALLGLAGKNCKTGVFGSVPEHRLRVLTVLVNWNELAHILEFKDPFNLIMLLSSI